MASESAQQKAPTAEAVGALLFLKHRVRWGWFGLLGHDAHVDERPQVRGGLIHPPHDGTLGGEVGHVSLLYAAVVSMPRPSSPLGGGSAPSLRQTSASGSPFAGCQL